MTVPTVWQDLLPPGPVGPGASTYAVALPDGRRILLPIRTLPGGTDAGVASLIVNQASFAVQDALADALAARLAPVGASLVVGVPTLGLSLAAAVARRLGHTRFAPLGTSVKFWYDEALSEPLTSITSPGGAKRLYVDPRLLPPMQAARVAVVDDVLSTGSSIAAVLRLLARAGVTPVAIGAAMLQGDLWRAVIPPGLPVHAAIETPRLARTPAGLGARAMTPDDLLPTARDEGAIRRHLALVALGRAPADRILRVGRMLDVHTGLWLDDAEIVIAGRRIAWTGPAGEWRGEAGERHHRPALAAVPGFGEVHKHIESSHLTPEHEAALVIPHGCTWTCEASHEYSNVDGPGNLDFWLAHRRAGMPCKIFPLPGSAVPPTGYEWGGGHFGRDEQSAFMATPQVAGLDEVMDWPAVWDATNPSHDRLWGMIEATFAARGVVEGHAAGMRDIADICAFAAAGMASDHEAWTAAEAMDKLRRGLFLEIRPHSRAEMIGGLLEMGLTRWDQTALCTDDRPAQDTLRLGATDHNVRLAIEAGLSPETAIAMVTLNPARHMRLTPWIGSIAPGRYADMVLLRDVASVDIAEVWADGAQVSDGATYLPSVPIIDRPEAATRSIRIDREITAADFAIPAPPGRDTVTAALLRPFHWEPEFLTATLPVVDGLVQRDAARTITKFAIVDRFSGTGRVARMFWRGTGPATPGTALACSMAHDKHNVWACGSCDAAMAAAVNAIREMQGGWALVVEGVLAATVRYEIGGLMTRRPAEALAAEMETLYAAAARVDWMWEPTSSPRWAPGFPERLAFATLTCAPWAWVLVAPSDLAPDGFVNVTDGRTHPIVW